MNGDPDKLKYFNMKTKEDKFSYLEAKLGSTGGHAREYLQGIMHDFMLRLKNIITYTKPSKRLSSKISLIKPEEVTCSNIVNEDLFLSEFTDKPVEVITVSGNHISMLSSPDLLPALQKLIYSK